MQKLYQSKIIAVFFTSIILLAPLALETRIAFGQACTIVGACGVDASSCSDGYRCIQGVDNYGNAFPAYISCDYDTSCEDVEDVPPPPDYTPDTAGPDCNANCEYPCVKKWANSVATWVCPLQTSTYQLCEAYCESDCQYQATNDTWWCPTSTADDLPPEGNRDVFAPPELGEGFDLGGLLTTLYKIMFPVAVLLGIILTIKAGYIFMTSQGDPRKVQEGKDGLTAAVMGLLFVLLSIVILRIIIESLITGTGAGF